MQEISITDEQEAAVAILFAAVMANGKNLTQSQIELLSRMLVLSSKFNSSSLNDLTVKALSLQAAHGSKALIEHSAPFITENFSETLFAMCCEIITSDGKIDDDESEVLGMIALYLGMSIENMKMMLTTYLVRNRWNVQIIEQ
ncbi:MAG: tellurite resistance TerB family protein [Flavisolibacter sp.]